MDTQSQRLVTIEEVTPTVQPVVIEEHELVQQTQKFLQALNDTNDPVGIILKTTPGLGHVVAYEQDSYVIVLPDGVTDAAKLYGNWEEALFHARRFLTKSSQSDKKSQILLMHYNHKKTY